MKYTVIELQNGVVGGNVWTFNEINSAENKFHTVLAAAAVSSVETHSAVLLNDSGYCVKHECYTHPAAAGEQ